MTNKIQLQGLGPDVLAQLGGGGSGGNSDYPDRDSMAVLATTDNLAVGVVVRTSGYANAGDGGHGMYIIRSGTTTEAYGDIQLQATTYAELIIESERVDRF